MIVACRGDGNPQKILIFVHRADHGAQKQQKLRVFVRCFAWFKQIDAGIGGKRPVVVFAAAVHPRKGLFMQKANHMMPPRNLFHQLHGELILVGGDISGNIDRRKLVLRGGSLVMLCLGKHTELPKRIVQILHKCRNTPLDHPEIVILQLLPLRGLRAEKRASGIYKIAALCPCILINQKIFLLRSHRRLDAAHGIVAEQAQHTQRLAIECLHRAKQRCFFVQRMPAPGAECRRDAEHAVLDERIGIRIPRGVAPCLKGCAKPARGERRGIRLALDQFLARENHDYPAALGGGDKAVVLFCGNTGHWLKPMRIMRCAFFNRPILHCIGDNIGNGAVKMLPCLIVS